MSMDVCSKCDAYVDTDFDLDCYVPDPRHPIKGGWDSCICEACRDRIAEQEEIADAAAALCEQQAERSAS